MSNFPPGSRVIHTEHPEFGIGTIKFSDEDPLDGSVIHHVTFDWKIEIVSCPGALLEESPKIESGASVNSRDLGGVEELRRRLGAALVYGENAQFGTFIRSFVTPLPHQAFLLEKVQSHARFGHLVADDVGMGKTIEAGMIISAVMQEKSRARVLVLSPKGLVLQWQDELEEHFNLRFSVAGRDFATKERSLWSRVDHVIASIDTLKQDRYESLLREIEPFDLIICDEAHRLTARREFLGGDLERTQSYRFVERLATDGIVRWVSDAAGKPRSPKIVLLTATPHQGDDLRFAYLLHLVRPDLVDPDNNLPLPENDEELNECMTRTPKRRAVNWDGTSIFKGHETQTRDISITDEERGLLGALTEYVKTKMVIATSGPAEALVRTLALHTYQKIASSSWAALESSLRARLSGRAGDFDEAAGAIPDLICHLDDPDADEGGENPGSSEREAIQSLLKDIEALPKDSKGDFFLDLVLRTPSFRERTDKLLVFTQFRETQLHLKRQLEAHGLKVAVIHGGLSLDERKSQREYFEASADVMISTEAGSEGANLHRKCHLMITYDLSWNPMRMLQRIGRLDRFGQKHRVKVINIRLPEAWDSVVSDKISDKLAVVGQTLSRIAEEDYSQMIMGEIYEAIDIGRIMSESDWGQDEEALDERISQEVEAVLRRQSEFTRICNAALGMPENYMGSGTDLGSEEFREVFSWTAAAHGIRLMETKTSDQTFLKGVYHFSLPAAFRSGLRASRECYLVFDRDRFSEVRGHVLGRARGQEIKPSLAGFGDPVTDWFVRTALSASKSGAHFAMRSPADESTEGKWWIVVFASWKKAEQWRGPESVFIISLDSNGNVLRQVPAKEVIRILGSTGLSTSDESLPIPPIESAMSHVRAALRERLTGQAAFDRALFNLVPWMAIRWD